MSKNNVEAAILRQQSCTDVAAESCGAADRCSSFLLGQLNTGVAEQLTVDQLSYGTALALEQLGGGTPKLWSS